MGRLVIATLAAAMLAAGCSDDDLFTPPDTEPPVATPFATVAPPTTVAPATTLDPAATTTPGATVDPSATTADPAATTADPAATSVAGAGSATTVSIAPPGECVPGKYTIDQSDTSRLRVANKFDVTVEALDAANADTAGYGAFFPGLEIVIPC